MTPTCLSGTPEAKRPMEEDRDSSLIPVLASWAEPIFLSAEDAWEEGGESSIRGVCVLSILPSAFELELLL